MKSKLKLITSMLIFGTIGIFVRYIPLSSAQIALFRGSIGCIFLLIVVATIRQPLSFVVIRKNAVYLLFSGCFLGLNWVMLFESYRYTTVATATLCYYLAPVLVLLLSPVVLREKLTLKKTFCMLVALIGMIFVSGVAEDGFGKDGRGILYGLVAAVFYAGVILINKKMHRIRAYDKTIVQLGISSVILGVYIGITGAFRDAFVGMTTAFSWILLLIVGIIHTGIAYVLYFSSMDANDGVSSQTAAVLSYIDPVTAIVLSAALLGEPITLCDAVGSVLVLGAAFVSELSFGEKKK